MSKTETKKETEAKKLDNEQFEANADEVILKKGFKFMRIGTVLRVVAVVGTAGSVGWLAATTLTISAPALAVGGTLTKLVPWLVSTLTGYGAGSLVDDFWYSIEYFTKTFSFNRVKSLYKKQALLEQVKTETNSAGNDCDNAIESIKRAIKVEIAHAIADKAAKDAHKATQEAKRAAKKSKRAAKKSNKKDLPAEAVPAAA